MTKPQTYLASYGMVTECSSQSSASSGIDVLKYAAAHASKTIRYSQGHMILHDGLLLHAIGVSSVAKPEGYRITFQGHGVRVGPNWKLYW